MARVEINAGICGFTSIVTAEDKGDYTAAFQLETQCPNWKKVNEILGGKPLNVMTELFKNKQTGKLDSEILNLSVTTIPHISCPVISGIFKALEVSVGLAIPKDAYIKFQDE